LRSYTLVGGPVADPLTLIGRWSRDVGFEERPESDVVLVFEPGGRGAIETKDERVELGWRLDADGGLLLRWPRGHESGPYRVEVVDLPLGRFWVLVSDGSLLPFDHRQFTRVEP
jgi:hypothetical protein